MTQPSFVLVIHAPSQPPLPREFAIPRVVIGREVGDLVLPDPQCSSTHGEISFDGTNVVYRDRGSTNGTWVNGQRVSEMTWTKGVSIQIGAHYVTLHEIRPAPRAFARTEVAQAAPQLQPRAAAVAYAPQAYAAPAQPPPQAYAGAPAQPLPQAGAHAPANAPTPPKKKGLNPLWIAIPLVLLGTCGAGVAGIAWLALKNADSPGSASGTGKNPPLAETRETTVRFVWFKGPVGPTASGGTSPARVRVAPNKTGAVSVGVSEEFAGGGGNQWRTATWLAAFNATRTLGASLADYEFSVHVGGHTDGPSAGMLTTTTMLSLLRGKPLREDSTMTGTINPDGTAGPVGGIVQKMHGAKDAGLKRFGFPIGSRNHVDLKTQNTVDLVSIGQELGLETKEIGDLYDAYEFMTGDLLPRVTPVAESELEPSPETHALLRAKISAWKLRVDREITSLKEEARRLGSAAQVVNPLLAQAEKTYENARRYESNSFLVPALDGYAETAIAVATATKLSKLLPLMASLNIPGLLEVLEASKTIGGDVEALGQELEVRAESKTRGGQVSATSAFSHYVQAKAATMIGDDFRGNAVSIIQRLANKELAASPQALQALLEQTTLPILYYEMARVYLDYAKDIQGLISDEGERSPLPQASVDRLVSGYASASGAVLAYFDALIVEEIAKENQLTADQAKFTMAQREPAYYLATKANMLSEYTGHSGAKSGVKLMRLAAASGAYLEGATLVNKWYSLGGSFDKAGELVLANRRALSAELDLAKRNALEAAARAKAAAGFVPTAARLTYQSAAARREGSDEDKLAALSSYWQSSFWSDLLAAE